MLEAEPDGELVLDEALEVVVLVSPVLLLLLLLLLVVVVEVVVVVVVDSELLELVEEEVLVVEEADVVVVVTQGVVSVKAAIPSLMAARIGSASCPAICCSSEGTIATRLLFRADAVASCWFKSSKVWGPAQAATIRSFLEIRSPIAVLMLVLRFWIGTIRTATSLSESDVTASAAATAAFVSATILSESVWIVVVSPPE